MQHKFPRPLQLLIVHAAQCLCKKRRVTVDLFNTGIILDTDKLPEILKNYLKERGAKKQKRRKK